MFQWFHLTLLPIVIALAVLPAGCSVFSSSYDEEYRDSKTIPPLDVPPELTKPDWNRRMEIPERSQRKVSAVETSRRDTVVLNGSSVQPQRVPVLPQYVDTRMRREGGARWLEASAPPDVLWPKLQAFWERQGIPLAKDEPQIGIMETEWHEDQQSFPSADAGDTLNGSAVQVGTMRAKYRLRLERVKDKITTVYLTQRRAELVGEDANGTPRWDSRAADPELQAEMLSRLMAFLGTPGQQTTQYAGLKKGIHITPTRITQVEGVPVLYVDDKFPVVWQRVGVALDRAGLYVEEQDSGKGIYYFSYTVDDEQDGKGFFSSWFGDDNDLEVNGRYELHLLRRGEKTLITAHHSSEDKKLLKPEAAEEILQRVHTAYNGKGSNI